MHLGLPIAVSVMLAAFPGAVFSQPAPGTQLQRGVSVQLPASSNAVAVPDADRQDALVVALTADGTVYLSAARLPMSSLAERLRIALSSRNDKTLYIKADARVPYARVVEVIDVVGTAGVEGLTLLTAQQDAAEPGTALMPLKGLEMRVVPRRP
jgi:biopolymer transport protein ExbD/biopolymer transport protein TolR